MSTPFSKFFKNSFKKFQGQKQRDAFSAFPLFFRSSYRLSLTGADKDNNEFGGSSDVDKFLSYIDAGDKKEEVVKIAGGERFFVAFIKKGAADDLSKGLK